MTQETWKHTKPGPESALQSIWTRGPWQLQKFLNKAWSVWYRGKPLHDADCTENMPSLAERTQAGNVFIVFGTLPHAKAFANSAIDSGWPS